MVALIDTREFPTTEFILNADEFMSYAAESKICLFT